MGNPSAVFCFGPRNSSGSTGGYLHYVHPGRFVLRPPVNCQSHTTTSDKIIVKMLFRRDWNL